MKNIETILLNNYLESIPKKGNYILGQQTEDSILVYQAFNNGIANYAITNQKFGGAHYSFNRMTWIKPNFLWMMYRCGWAQKQNQERVLAIWIKKTGFLKILEHAVYSSFKRDIYATREDWKNQLTNEDVRLQWDPDHDIYGAKQERRAIQLGLKNEMLNDFNQTMITEIIDVTNFVKEQKNLIDSGEVEKVRIPKERIFEVENASLKQKLNLDD